MTDQEKYQKFVEWLDNPVWAFTESEAMMPMITSYVSPEEAEFNIPPHTAVYTHFSLGIAALHIGQKPAPCMPDACCYGEEVIDFYLEILCAVARQSKASNETTAYTAEGPISARKIVVVHGVVGSLDTNDPIPMLLLHAQVDAADPALHVLSETIVQSENVEEEIVEAAVIE